MNTAPNCPALVLNADYAPLQIWPLSTWDFERTMRNVLKGRVSVVAEYDTVLRSPTMSYRPPSVVALKSYVKVPSKVPFSRMNILLRDGFACQYCGVDLKLNEMTFDHVVPRAKGGATSYANIVCCCSTCNSRKADKTDMRPRRIPDEPDARNFWKAKPAQIATLHQTWLDALYWSGVLEQN